MKFKPRDAQKEIIDYQNGFMGVSAVPGSGKTHTLSYLASKLIIEGHIADDQEILIVTLVNSAVNNFSKRIEGFIKQAGLIPGIGYRVRTLHGLANDIVKEKYGLLGLSENYQIIDEREREVIINDIVHSLTKENSNIINLFSNSSCDLSSYKLQRNWWNLLSDIISAFISEAKNYQLSNEALIYKYDKNNLPEPLLEFGINSFTQYQQILNYRNALDFDDLIANALNALNIDSEYLDRISYRWPYILEDEAQDSNRLQELILRKISSKNGNWVRVGDPNQAIYESFTTANPEFLLGFIASPNTIKNELPNSGRSTKTIISLANHLISWTRENHPNTKLRDALNLPLILPTSKDDPQPNPTDNPCGVYITTKELSPEQEIDLIISSIKRWLPNHSDQTVAVLVPRNDRGAKVVEKLNENHIEYVELLKSSLSTRETAKVLSNILKYLNEPASKSKLLTMIDSILINETDLYDINSASDIKKYIKNIDFIEEYIWPIDYLDYDNNQLSENMQSVINRIKEYAQRWQQASLLPIDQLLIIISQDIFSKPEDLALAYKLALTLEMQKNKHSGYGLVEFIEELDLIAKNRYRYLGFSNEDMGFDPDKHPGKVAVATIHKGKGLEWDRVYLMSINNYNFPSAEAEDSYISEKWFVTEKMNLIAETLSKLNELVNDTNDHQSSYGNATIESRIKYSKERIRLLYVGITRARKEIMISWNTGKNSKNTHPARPLLALNDYILGINNGFNKK